MDMNACLAIVLGCLSVAKAQDTFCSRGFCFIRPDPNSGKQWSDAQQICKDNNSTLPIANDTNSRMSVIEALDHFQLHGSDAWLGATAFDNGPDIWRWLNGSQYNGTDVQQRGEYSKSYAYVAKTTILGVLAYAFSPSASYSYICQCKATNTESCTNGTGRTAFVRESQCFMIYDETLSWFYARNKCLATSCDLASFSQLSILDGMVDSRSGGFWVGLRTSQWNWQNAVTGLSSDVTFTSWSIGQPDDTAPHCMATNSGNFPNWKDFDCTQVYPYICQVSDKSSSNAATNPSATTPTSSTSFSSTPTSTSTTKSQLVTPGTGSSSASLSTTPSSNTTDPSDLASTTENNKNSTNAVTVNLPLAIGLGVGLGVLFIIIIVVVIVVVAVVLRRKRRNSTESGNAKSTKKFVTNTSEENRDDGTTERSENKKKGRTQADDSVDQYATVTSTFYPDAKFDTPANPGTVYADLRFNPDDP